MDGNPLSDFLSMLAQGLLIIALPVVIAAAFQWFRKFTDSVVSSFIHSPRTECLYTEGPRLNSMIRRIKGVEPPFGFRRIRIGCGNQGWE